MDERVSRRQQKLEVILIGLGGLTVNLLLAYIKTQGISLHTGPIGQVVSRLADPLLAKVESYTEEYIQEDL